MTQKVKEIKITERVHPEVAKRKKWAKFGAEKNSKPGPDFRTTQLGEPVNLRLGVEWKQIEKEEADKKKEALQQNVSGKGLTCRVCGGAHFTSKCPYKEQLGVDPDAGVNPELNGGSGPGGAGGADIGKSGYVPPHLRKKMAGGMTGMEDESEKREEQSSTLRFSQLNENVDSEDLRQLLGPFNRYITRVTVVSNPETGRSRGFGYVEFINPQEAQECLERFDGKGFRSLILRVEFSRQRRQIY